jgi:hypothetical protein
MRLWEIEHPYYGPDDNTNHCADFTELRESIDSIDEDMNHVYRWDWTDWSQPQHDSLFLEGDDRSKQEFTAHLVLPRKSMFINFVCPITHEQETEVLAWLRGRRILGALKAMWAPILDGAE